MRWSLARPQGMNVGIHICRSQDPSWQADVGYDPIAEPMFNDMQVKLYFLEYDNARAGTFAPLRACPKDKIVVLGLVASKVAGPRTRRLPQAPHRGSQPLHRLEQLALSPQCGFSTSATEPAAVSEELEMAKLARIVQVAREVWGG